MTTVKGSFLNKVIAPMTTTKMSLYGQKARPARVNKLNNLSESDCFGQGSYNQQLKLETRVRASDRERQAGRRTNTQRDQERETKKEEEREVKRSKEK